MDAFYSAIDEADMIMQRNTLLGTKIDYRRPPLLTAEDVANLKAPVYTMVADNEVFFPGDKAIEKCRKIVKNFAGSHVLRNTKHVPDKSIYPEIESKLRDWLFQK